MSFLLVSCSSGNDSKVFKVTIGQTANGKITATPTSGPDGTEISVSVNPDSGFKYVEGSLKYNQTLIPDTGDQPWFFTLSGNVTLSAEFIALPADNYSVTIGQLSNGTIIANPMYGTEDTKITLTITPRDGYVLKEDTLTLTPEEGAPEPIVGNTFNMPAANVTVTAQFELGTLTTFIDAGLKALEEGNFDAAISAFESAWEMNKNDPEAIVYSTLAQLVAIAVDPKVNTFMKDRLGIKSYPGSINRLVNPNWMETYNDLVRWYYDYELGSYVDWWPDDDLSFFDHFDLDPIAGYYKWTGSTYELVCEEPIYRDTLFPGMEIPEWIAGTEYYKYSLAGPELLQSSSTIPILLFANLIDKNTAGLNNLLDDLLDSVFGTAFEAAYTRAKTLNDQVLLGEDALRAFGIDAFFEGEEIYISKAELNVLFAAIRLFKANLEWIAAYNWNTNLNFLKSSDLWNDLDSAGVNGPLPADLPLRNNFLKDRGNGNKAKSRANYIKAIDDLIESYDFWIGELSKLPSGYKNTLNDFAWLKDGFSKLRNTINTNGTFYITDSPGGNEYDNSPEGAQFGINFDKFFNPGQFSLDRLVETTTSTKGLKPIFYGFDDEETEDWVEITDRGDIRTKFVWVAFKFDTTPLSEVVIIETDIPDNFMINVFWGKQALTVWDWYH
ncbi:MAG: hypothetical protein LBC80_01340 [Treponema sp.]|jgi:hypothetical protein|nr:hypothetical protein [Treponema sp.]